jgi:hypothetical protein
MGRSAKEAAMRQERIRRTPRRRPSSPQAAELSVAATPSVIAGTDELLGIIDALLEVT